MQPLNARERRILRALERGLNAPAPVAGLLKSGKIVLLSEVVVADGFGAEAGDYVVHDVAGQLDVLRPVYSWRTEARSPTRPTG